MKYRPAVIVIMLIVVSAKNPDFSVSLVDQMLVMSNYHKVLPILIVISAYFISNKTTLQ